MIVIIDYGMGNLYSVKNALDKIGAESIISNDINQIRKADRLILPGVGAFKDCMKQLAELGLIEVIKTEVIENKKPLLGICLGMQALFEESEEGGLCKGLGLLKGRVVKMCDEHARIPHIGWNLLETNSNHPLFQRLSARPFVYYVHSYYAVDVEESLRIGYSTYHSLNICGLVQKDHILGAQFHPEKSGEDGLAILRYFKEEFA